MLHVRDKYQKIMLFPKVSCELQEISYRVSLLWKSMYLDMSVVQEYDTELYINARYNLCQTGVEW
jgi:hypothetical protein